ncbi:MAG: hypothetical protein HYY22_03805 [Thaumarchaeota archaeon]|nr:hypothetical protein [Nitrososphaerota archaeon]
MGTSNRSEVRKDRKRTTPRKPVESPHVTATTAPRRQIMPRLDTLEMIEDTIRKQQYFESKTKLWKALPRGVQYGTLTVALSYLERSNKITQNKDGSIVWIFVESERARKSLQESTEL